MSIVRELHDKAMGFAQDAIVLRHHGKMEKAEALTRKAMELEIEAAGMIPCSKDSEPSYSIMYLSAASLALQCNDPRVGELADKGLLGYPSEYIRTELEMLKQGAVVLPRPVGAA